MHTQQAVNTIRTQCFIPGWIGWIKTGLTGAFVYNKTPEYRILLRSKRQGK